MSRFNFEDKDNYGGGSSNYFTLKEDKDTAIVRFLYNDINDIEGVAVHEIEVNNTRMDIECLRSYNEPLDNCPFCAAGMKQVAKMFIPVYDERTKESKIWTRGKTFFKELAGLCSRYNPLVGTKIEIERHGKKGDTNTTYGLYPMQSDNSIIADFPEIKPEGVCFQQKTIDDMNYYLENGIFPEEIKTRSNRTQQPISQRQSTREMPVRRRPNYGSEEDSF